MRVLWAPVIVSSAVLGGWLTSAVAQQTVTGPGAPVPTTSEPARQADSGERHFPGAIEQPTRQHPGLVAGITVGELYTDNLRLSGQGKQGSWVTSVKPFIKSAYDGPRLSGVLDLSLTGYHYMGHSDRDQAAGDFRANGTLMLVPEHLYLDGWGSYRRQIINRQLPSGSGTFFLGGNRANVFSAALSPYWRQELGHYATMVVRYTHGRVVYNRRGITGEHGRENRWTGISNATSDAAHVSVASPDYDVWQWNFSYDADRVSQDHGRTLKFETAKLQASRQLSNHVRVIADVGRQNRYLPDGTVDQMGATLWDVGFSWVAAHSRFKAMGGHRFYGRRLDLSWKHEAALLTWGLGYEERPTNLDRELIGNGSMRIPQVSRVIGVPSLFDRRIYLMKRATGYVTYEMRTGQATLSVADTSRDYFLSDRGTDKVARARVSWLYMLGPFTSIKPEFGWRRSRFASGQVTYSRDLRISVVHQFTPADSATLDVRHRSRDVHRPIPGARSHDVNVIYVRWTHTF